MGRDMRTLLDGAFCASLEWHKGTDEGTAGKNSKGVAQWYDGDTLLAIVETNHGREISVVHISCDEHYFSLEDSNGEMWGWGLDDIEWWARLDKESLPAVEREKAPVGDEQSTVAARGELARLYEQDATYNQIVKRCKAMRMSQVDTLAVALVAKARECQSYKHSLCLATERDGRTCPKVEWELPNI